MHSMGQQNEAKVLLSRLEAWKSFARMDGDLDVYREHSVEGCVELRYS